MSQDIFVNAIEILSSDVATSSTASLYTYGGISIYSTQDATDFSSSSAFLLLGGAIIEKSTIIGGITKLLNTTISTSISSGALIISGGLGVNNI